LLLYREIRKLRTKIKSHMFLQTAGIKQLIHPEIGAVLNPPETRKELRSPVI
jgi:hypothetical protein